MQPHETIAVILFIVSASSIGCEGAKTPPVAPRPPATGQSSPTTPDETKVVQQTNAAVPAKNIPPVRVLIGRDTEENILVRFVAATTDKTRGAFVHAKFVSLDENQKEYQIRFSGNLTTHEMTLLNVILSCVPDEHLYDGWKDAKMNAIFSIPKEVKWDDFSHWYLVSIRALDEN